MFELNKENLLSYVASKLDFFDSNGIITISAVGEGSAEEDGDGFINHVFRISDGSHGPCPNRSFIGPGTGRTGKEERGGSEEVYSLKA